MRQLRVCVFLAATAVLAAAVSIRGKENLAIRPPKKNKFVKSGPRAPSCVGCRWALDGMKAGKHLVVTDICNDLYTKTNNKENVYGWCMHSLDAFRGESECLACCGCLLRRVLCLGWWLVAVDDQL